MGVSVQKPSLEAKEAALPRLHSPVGSSPLSGAAIFRRCLNPLIMQSRNDQGYFALTATIGTSDTKSPQHFLE
jgi:hypothetical protein